jgi:mevalonate kinase
VFLYIQVWLKENPATSEEPEKIKALKSYDEPVQEIKKYTDPISQEIKKIPKSDNLYFLDQHISKVHKLIKKNIGILEKNAKSEQKTQLLLNTMQENLRCVFVCACLF